MAYLDAIRREIIQQKLEPELSKVLLAEQETKGFERRAARRYCTSIAPIYFDDSFAYRTEEEIKQLAQSGVRNLMVNYDLRSAQAMLRAFRYSMTQLYEVVADALQSGEESTIWSYLTERHIGDKDAKMERKLREVATENPNSRIATVTGLKHIIRDPRQQSFYSRIVDFDPERSILYGFDF